MFFRRKISGRTEDLQIVKNDRVAGKPRHSVVATLGRVDELAQDGTLDRRLRSAARFARSAVVLTADEQGDATTIAPRQLGPALVFERLGRESGCPPVIRALAAERDFPFDLERAVCLTVLHRRFDPGSDRAAEKWRHGLVIDGVAGLELHQRLTRAWQFRRHPRPQLMTDTLAQRHSGEAEFGDSRKSTT